MEQSLDLYGASQDWEIMQLLQDAGLEKIINQIPEEELRVPGALEPLDPCSTQENLNQEYLNQELTYFNLNNQENCASVQCSPHPAVIVKQEAPDRHESADWWGSCTAPARTITSMDGLPNSPSSWEDYSFNFGPSYSPGPSGSPGSPGQESEASFSSGTVDGGSMTISRRSRNNEALGNSGKPDTVRKLRRREQNRVAAQRCRTKKKMQTQQTVQEFQDLQRSHDRLVVEVDYLKMERRRLEKVLEEHMQTCRQGPRQGHDGAKDLGNTGKDLGSSNILNGCGEGQNSDC